MRSDWMLSKMENQIALAKNWVRLLSLNGESWNIHREDDWKELPGLIGAAEKVLEKAKSSDRNHSDTQRCNDAFAALTSWMRDFKTCKVFSPPFTNGDLVDMGFKPRDSVKSVIAATPETY